MSKRITDIDFKNIQPHNGNQRSSFEDLCCHLFYCSLSDSQKESYTRFNGEGGDGGVECIAVNAKSERIGVQAKYVFEFEKLKTQATASFITAIQNYPDIKEYYLFFPFDLTGNTTKRKGSLTKFEEWKTGLEEKAREDGYSVRIIKKSKADIESSILSYDVNGSILLYFFGQENIDVSWFARRVEESIQSVGNRYNSKFQVPTETTDVLESFCITSNYKSKVMEILKKLSNAIIDISSDLDSYVRNSNHLPDCYDINQLKTDLRTIRTNVLEKGLMNGIDVINKSIELVGSAIDSASSIYNSSKDVYEEKHGKGSATSEGLRQFNAEYNCSFPTEHLDSLDNWIKELREFYSWLSSAVSKLVFEQSLVLTGLAGRGKTNAMCNIAKKLSEEGRPCCLFTGSQFLDSSSILNQIKDILRFPHEWSIDNILEVFELVSENHSVPFVILIDAINETGKLGNCFWSTSIPNMMSSIKKYKNIKVCFSCRSGFDSFCIPKDFEIATYECLGFKSIEAEAIRVFFDNYNLIQPTYPLLNEEFSNPLFLTLFCEILSQNPESSLFTNWIGFNGVFRAYFESLSNRYNKYFGSFGGKDIIDDTISFIGNRIIESSSRSIPRKELIDEVALRNPDADKNYIDWLISENLFISNDGYSNLLLSFDLMNDYVIAKSLYAIFVREKVKISGLSLFSSIGQIKTFNGAITLFSNMLSESQNGKELTDFFENSGDEIRHELALIVLNSLKTRNPVAITDNTKRLVLSLHGITFFELYNSILPLAVVDCCLDIYFLTSYYVPIHDYLANKDFRVCPFLYDSYDNKGIVYHIISIGCSLSRPLGDENAFRYCLVLALFTSASDRRVKDYSTRALVNLLLLHPHLTYKFLKELSRMNYDGVVFERAFLAVYGLLVLSNNQKALTDVLDAIDSCYAASSVSDYLRNGAIRDFLSRIIDLAKHNNLDGYYLNYMEPMANDFSWLSIQETDINEYMEKGERIRFQPNEFLSDFYKYSLSRILGYWTDGRSWEKKKELKNTASKWIIDQIINEYGYNLSNCSRIDDIFVGKYGGGRGRKRWAERIGKKYQWLAAHEFVSVWYDYCCSKKKKQSADCFIDCRELDPTVLSFIPAIEDKDVWWHHSLSPLCLMGSCQNWIDDIESIPEMKALLSLKEHEGQSWLTLATSYSQTEETDYRSSAPYRHTWMFLWGYVVKKKDLSKVQQILKNANFEGRWMPEPPYFGSPHFVGEYDYKTKDEEVPSNLINGTDICVVPAWKKFLYEWEYDATCESESSTILIPPQKLLNEAIRWDGKGGWIDSNTSKTVFKDPSLVESGARTLLVDYEYISSWLKRHKCVLLWTLLGERLVLRDDIGKEKPLSFSQIAWLDEDGKPCEAKRNYYDFDDNRLLEKQSGKRCVIERK